MTSSSYFSTNPDLYVFLPIFYVVWSDTILTPEETKHVRNLINGQSWLKEDERSFLLHYLNPEKPPAPDEIKSWYSEICKVENETNDQDNLIDIGVRLVKFHSPDAAAKRFDAAKLQDIENALGVISNESIATLFPERRKTIAQTYKTRPSFDVTTLSGILDGHEKELIDRVKQILTGSDFTYYAGESMMAYREQVLSWCKILADHGLGAYGFPEQFGGKNDMAGYFAIMETLSYHDLSTVIKFGVQFGLWGMSVYFLGTEKHHQKYLADIGSLRLPGCFAMTETNHGSNVKGIETTATYNHQTKSLTIHTPYPEARKEYIGNAALHGKMATVFAKLMIDGTDYGVNAFIVPLRDDDGNLKEGIRIEDCGKKMGLNGVDNGVIYFDQVIVPVDNMLDRFARISADGKFESSITSDNRRFFTMLGTLVGGRIGIPRSGNAACKSGLTIAIRYGDKRKQFGPEGGAEVPILNYRTHQRRLMPLLATTYALHFSLQHVTQRFINRTEKEMQEIEALAAGLKAFGTWHTTHTLQECREACGGKGYLAENRISDLKNDTDVYTTFEGDNTVLMQLVAKSRLSEFKQEFGNMNMFGMLNYVADQAKTSFTEMNPIIIRNTDEDHLLDPEFHLNAFRYRERDILTSAARRFKKHLDAGMDSFDAVNQTQFHMVNVGFAYIERIILEQFQRAVETIGDPDCKRVLSKLCSLFALSQIEKNKGWYLEHDYMEGVKTKAIRKLINKLVWEIRQDAVPLVDAFMIPENCLAAPIATSAR